MDISPAAITDTDLATNKADLGFASEAEAVCPLEALHSSVASLFPNDYVDGSRDVVALYNSDTGIRTVEVVRAQEHRFEVTLANGRQVWIYGANGQYKAADLFLASVRTGYQHGFMQAGDDRDILAGEILDLISNSSTDKPASRVARWLGRLSKSFAG